ncbi:MAG: hypothetical protein N4A33_08500 [Bacteriovoracaceae bacterium]|jgi:hypothetical protein|nr:hypothetical protein [Bacteriovoracaceae bacterium]
MKKLLVGLLAIGSISSYANSCNINNLWLNFENEVEREVVIDAIKSKGYTIDFAEKGLSLSIGFQKEGKSQRQQQGYTQASKKSLGLAVENMGIAISNASSAITDTVSHVLKRKRSEHLIIADNSEALYSYRKKISRLSSNKSRVEKLLNQIPNCEEL